jgi:hypothetical protein
VQRRPALPRGRSKALTLLSALAATLAGEALAQNTTPDLLSPALTDPNNTRSFSRAPPNAAASTQRFGRAPDGTTRSTQPVATPSASAGAGETGFDSTGSIAKQRRTRRRPGSTFPVPRATTPTLYGAPQQTTGQTSAPQIAIRGAYANAFKPPDAPVRRPLPPNVDPYEPIGVRVGEFLLRPSLEVNAGTDSNPNRTPNGQRSNFVEILGDAKIKSEWSRHELGATLRGSYIAYDRTTADDRPAADTKVFGRYDVTRDLRLEGEGRFLLGTDNPGSPNLQAGLAKLPIFTVWGITAGAAQRFNRLDLSVKGSVDRTEYADSELTDGTTVSNADRNYYQYRIQGRVSYEFTPGLKPFVEIDADQRKYEDVNIFEGVDRSSTGVTPKVGVTFELARRLTGEISTGYTTRDYVSPDLPTLRGWVLDSSLVWTATGLTTVTLSASSRVEESTLAGVSGALKRDIGIQVDHAFRRWLIGTVKAGYGQDDYVGSDRVDNRMSLGAMIAYKFTREFWLKGEFRQEWMRSNAPNVDYDASIFLVGVKMQR